MLTVWPSYDEPWAAECLRVFTGKSVIYVGEGEGGCTADSDFHELLDTKFALTAVLEIPQFWGINDRLKIYERT